MATANKEKVLKIQGELTPIRQEEALKYLWLKEEGWQRSELKPILKYQLSDEDFLHLEELGLATRKHGDWELTDEGRRVASDIIRRTRLAEWLFREILKAPETEIEESACKMEHLLTEETATRICTLLGHPKTCPHGKPIPRGKCCIENRKVVEPLFVPLTHVPINNVSKVVSITVEESRAEHILASLGLIPGVEIKVIQRTPSFIVEIDETVLALDKDLAERIYVRILRKPL